MFGAVAASGMTGGAIAGRSYSISCNGRRSTRNLAGRTLRARLLLLPLASLALLLSPPPAAAAVLKRPRSIELLGEASPRPPQSQPKPLLVTTLTRRPDEDKQEDSEAQTVDADKADLGAAGAALRGPRVHAALLSHEVTLGAAAGSRRQRPPWLLPWAFGAASSAFSGSSSADGSASTAASESSNDASGASGVRISSRQLRALHQSLEDASDGHPSDAASKRPGLSLVGRGVATAGDSRPREVSRLKDLYGSEYIGPISVGTSAKGSAQAELNVIYDTGSADLWISSDLCTKWPCGGVDRRQYDHKQSLTYHSPKQSMNFTTTYGSGELFGFLGIDDVRLGPLVAKEQMVGLIAEESGEAFMMLPFDGIVGLAFPRLAMDPGLSLLGRLSQNGMLERTQFAFYLHRDPKLGGGVLWGGVDRRLYEGELQLFPVVEELYWALDLLSFQVGDKTFDFAEEEKKGAPPEVLGFGGFANFSGLSSFGISGPDDTPAVDRRTSTAPRLIVDSGTTFYTAEGEIYAAIMERIPSTPCNQIKKLPSLIYTLRDVSGVARKLTIPPEEYMVDGGGRSSGRCSPGIVRLGINDQRPTMILGEVFMRHYFTVFSAEGIDRSQHRSPPASGTATDDAASAGGAAGDSPTSAPPKAGAFDASVGFARARFDAGADAFFAEISASSDV